MSKNPSNLQAVRHRAHPWKKKYATGEMDLNRLNKAHVVPTPRQNTNKTRETQG